MLKNHSIKSVLILISSVLAIANVLFVLLLWNGFQNIEQHLVDAAQKQTTADLLSETRFHIVQIQQFLTDVGATHDDDGFTSAKENLNSALNKLDGIAKNQPSLFERCESLKRQINAMHDAGVKMGWDYINLGNEAGTVTMKAPNTGLDDTAARLTDELQSLVKQVQSDLAKAREELDITIHGYSTSLIGFAVGLLLFVVCCLTLVYFKIEPPLSALKQSLDAIKQGGGDLTRRIPHEGKDEIGEIVSLFNDFLTLLHSLIRQVAMETDQLVITSNRLSQMSERSRQDMSKQQLGTDQVATTVTELSATVTEVANNTFNAAQAAARSSSAANNGKTTVASTVNAIHVLSSGIDKASSVIANVENDCKNVSSVLDVIQSIADQTNLLALNAAIEAARAGEQGRGFAVVADEVRTLASRTQASTHEIQAMIERLQNGSREAVKAMAESQGQARETVGVIENTGNVLDDISSMVAQISDMNGHISNAVKEQKIVVEHINQNVIAINDVTLASTADAQQTENEAHQLQKIAKNIQSSISQFKL